MLSVLVPSEDGLVQITLILSFLYCQLRICSLVSAKSGATGPLNFQFQNLVAVFAFLSSLSSKVYLINTFGEILVGFQKQIKMHISAFRLNTEASCTAIQLLVFILPLKICVL